MQILRITTALAIALVVGVVAGKCGSSGPTDITGYTSIYCEYDGDGWLELRGPARHAVVDEWPDIITRAGYSEYSGQPGRRLYNHKSWHKPSVPHN